MLSVLSYIPYFSPYISSVSPIAVVAGSGVSETHAFGLALPTSIAFSWKILLWWWREDRA